MWFQKSEPDLKPPMPSQNQSIGSIETDKRKRKGYRTIMPHAILASQMGEAMAAGFGIAVGAVVLGTFVLRWYRMRHEFILTKLALEKGVTLFVPTQPSWLASLRQGVLILALGATLIVLGAIGWN